VLSPSQITADQNDYNPTGLSAASVLRLSTDASRTLTGLAGGAGGRLLVVNNVGSSNVIFKAESASSTASNRFALAQDLILAPNQTVLLQYDATSSRWRPGAGVTLANTLLAVTSANASLTSSTYAGTIGVPLEVGATYQIEVWVPYAYSAGTPGIKVRLHAFGGLTLTDMRVAGQITAEGAMAPSSTALETDIVAGAPGTGNRAVHILGTVAVNVGGVLLPQWAQNTTDATNALTIYRGAFVKAVKVYP
jgi:hypothetical protein